ncbi:LamG-like jellyroll fold domain-containing protein [Mesorhizobium sp. M0488]|uniref:beta strand repeat-containing protein n=1 Tax=unclassified Mesorhizobium TaxID=325217 RepID=UPI003335D91B
MNGQSEGFAITGSGSGDTITGGTGGDSITGGAGADILTGGLGADTFVIGAAADVAAAETINGTLEQLTLDTLRLDAAGTYSFAGVTLTSIDRMMLNQDASGFNLVLANAQVSSADGNLDGTLGDLLINSAVAMTNGVTIDASGLTGANRITVDGTNLGGSDIITGGAGADTIAGGAGADALTGGDGNDVFNLSFADAVSGETLDGGNDIDTIRIADGSGHSGNLSGQGVILAVETLSSIERLEFATTASPNFWHQIIINASQIGSGLSSSLEVQGDANGNIMIVSVDANQSVSLAGWTFSGFGANNGASDQLYLTGSTGAETITGSSYGDVISGGVGNDYLTGGGGDDVIDGGDGTGDTAIYTGAWLDYMVTNNGGGSYTIADNRALSPDGTDTVSNVENFTFSNGTFTARQIANDQPTLAIADTSGDVTEGDGTASLSDSGILSFADLDTNDAVTVSETSNADIVWSGGTLSAALAATLVAGFSVDQDSWDYTTNASLDFLGAGETITFSYNVVATDDSGAPNAVSAVKTVTITINGTNDGPVATSDIGVGDPLSLPSNLIARWSADGTTEDVVGDNDGVLQNGASFATGKFGLAFSFDGVDDVFQAPTTGLPVGNSDRTLSLWVNADAFVNSESLLAGYGNFGSGGQTYQLGTSGNTLFFSQWGSAVFGPSLQTGQWYNVAVTNVGDSVTLYLDGVAVGSGTMSINTPAGTEFLAGARPSVNVPGLLQGQVDDIQLYDRALTAQEIQSIYNAASPTGNVLDNDTDVDHGDSMSVIGVAAGTSAEDVSGQVGSAVVGTYGALTLGSDGAWSYERDNNDPDTQQLGQGQAASDVFTYTMTDTHDATATTTLTITTHGSNDQPTLAIAETSGDVTEGDGTASLSDSGILSFADLDTTDVVTVSETYNNDIAWSGGTLSAAQQAAVISGFSVNQDSWDYATNANLDFLGAGETITLSYDLVATDDSGAPNAVSAAKTVTITIHGTNDQPTLAIADTSGDVTEGDGTASLSDSGILSFADLDTNDAVTVSETSNADIVWSGGTLSAALAATLVAGFSVDQDSWDYTTNASLDFLGAGETITFSYNVVATDDSGAPNAVSAVKTVTITINGTNDGPVATSDIGVGDPLSLPSNLIARWSADGTTEDVVGDNDGVLQNGASFATGKFGLAFSFDGVDDVFQAPTTGLPVGNSDRTLSLWVNADAFVNSESLLAGYGNFGSGGQTYQLGTSGNTLFFSQWGSAVFGPSLQTGQWYNVAVTNVGDSVTLYLDGVAVGSGTMSINTPAGTEFLAGARPSVNVPGLLQGQVDDIQLYDRALTAQEIQSIYNAASPTGNVLDNDTDVDHGDSMSVIGVAAGTSAEDVSGQVGSAVVGTYGALTLGSDGAWSYERDNNDPDTQQLGQGQAASDVFTYTMTDTHDATATTTLTITTHGSTSSSSGTLAFANLADTGSSNSNEITRDDSFDLSATGNDAGTVSYEVSTNGGPTWSPTTRSQTSTAGNATTYTGPISAGADSFDFSALTDGSDTITAFSRGIDSLRVSAAGFGGGLVAGGAVTLVTTADAASALNGGRDGYFIFDDDGAGAGTLYFDATGGTGEDAIAFAQFTGLPSFLPSDIGLF